MGTEVSVQIECDEGIKMLFEMSLVKGSKDIIKLKVKAPKDKKLDGSYRGKKALTKAAFALEYAESNHPEVKLGLSSFHGTVKGAISNYKLDN